MCVCVVAGWGGGTKVFCCCFVILFTKILLICQIGLVPIRGWLNQVGAKIEIEIEMERERGRQ